MVTVFRSARFARLAAIIGVALVGGRARPPCRAALPARVFPGVRPVRPPVPPLPSWLSRG